MHRVIRAAEGRALGRRVLLVLALLLGGCAPPNDDARRDTDGAAADRGPVDAGVLADAPDSAAADGGPASDAGDQPVACDIIFRYVPAGPSPTQVVVAGEWNDFSTSDSVMQGPDAEGAFTTTVALLPGLHAYKLVIDGDWQLDPAAHLRKYVGGTEYSAVRVADCRLPTLAVAQRSITRPSSGHGRFAATVAFTPGVDGSALAPATVHVTLRQDQTSTGVAGVTVTGSQMTLDVPDLADGKYTVLVEAADQAGRAAHPLRLVFWIEAEPFEWRDAVIYMAMTDRFRNGDPSNDPGPTSGADPRADWKGGDLEGVREAVADGTFDRLGVRALWLSPFNTNPSTSYLADDGVHQIAGYHGYWPVRAREVEPRIGGAAALHALVNEAHAHGIRVLADFVVNHVHQEHEYYQGHPEWFRTGCVCGTSGCDWTTHRLDCVLATYLPDVNWTVPAVSEQYADDAVYWLSEFDLDGLRVDAVKSVEDLAVMNLSTRIREEFEAAGTRVFLTGETAAGWNDCGLDCNLGEYGAIGRYIGPYQLDGQADFVLYHAVPYRVFAYGDKDLIHVDYWTQQSLTQYPAGAIMTPYVGSHDTARFVTLGSYRGQDAAHDRGIAFNRWDNVASAPPDTEPYARHRLALSWLLTAPGAPLLYYGDECGAWGGADPNNRAMWRGQDALNAEETATLQWTQALGTARRELVALRRGDYQSLSASADVLVFARSAGAGDAALVALSRSAVATTTTVSVPAALGLAGTTLHDRLGGAAVTVTAGAASISLDPRGAAVLAP